LSEPTNVPPDFTYQAIAFGRGDSIIKYEHFQENEISKLIKFINFFADKGHICSKIEITKWNKGVRQ
jgi:hypothetical protein